MANLGKKMGNLFWDPNQKELATVQLEVPRSP